MQPDENRLEALIGAAFDRLPEPEAARLKALEVRVLRQATRAPREQRSRATYWWLIAALTATGAAAWWAGEYFSEGLPKQTIEQVAPTRPEKTERGKAPERAGERQERSSDTGAPAKTKKSPTIYRREMY